MRFGWDPAKDERNRQKRGFGFDFAALIIESDTIEWLDNRHDTVRRVCEPLARWMASCCMSSTPTAATCARP